MLRDYILTLLLCTSHLVEGYKQRPIFAPSPLVDLEANDPALVSNEAIIAALQAYDDPVEALIALRPDAAAEMAQPRLLHLMGQKEPEWLTEGDKLRLRKKGKKFMDITDHSDFYDQQTETLVSGKASKQKSQTATSTRSCGRSPSETRTA